MRYPQAAIAELRLCPIKTHRVLPGASKYALTSPCRQGRRSTAHLGFLIQAAEGTTEFQITAALIRVSEKPVPRAERKCTETLTCGSYNKFGPLARETRDGNLAMSILMGMGMEIIFYPCVTYVSDLN
jgi:hypothetical protein